MGANFDPMPSRGFSAPRQRTDCITETPISEHAFANVPTYLVPLVTLTAPLAWKRSTDCALMRWLFLCCEHCDMGKTTDRDYCNRMEPGALTMPWTNRHRARV